MRRLAGPPAPVTSLAVSPDGRWLGAVYSTGGALDRNLCLWDLHAGGPAPAKTLPGQALHVAFAPDSGSLVLAGHGDSLRRYALPGLESLNLRTPPMTGAAFFTPDGAALWALKVDGTQTGVVRVPLATAGRVSRGGLALDLVRPVPARFLPSWPALSPDGLTLATVARPTEAPRSGLLVCLWDLAKQKLAAKFSIRRGRCESLHFAPDGRRLAVVSNHQVLVWDVATRKRLAVLDGPPGVESPFALWAAFTPDGRHLLAAFNDRVLVFDALTWTPLKTYDWSVGSVLRVAVTPDGLCSVAAGNAGEIAVWDFDG